MICPVAVAIFFVAFALLSPVGGTPIPEGAIIFGSHHKSGSVLTSQIGQVIGEFIGREQQIVEEGHADVGLFELARARSARAGDS